MPSTDDAPEMVPATPPTNVTHAAALAKGREEAAAEIDEVEAKVAEAEAVAADEDAPPAPARTYPEDHPHYVIVLWKNIPCYQCKDCSWSKATHDERQGVSMVMQHWVETHSEDANTEMVPTGLVDQQGKPVMRRQARRRR